MATILSNKKLSKKFDDRCKERKAIQEKLDNCRSIKLSPTKKRRLIKRIKDLNNRLIPRIVRQIEREDFSKDGGVLEWKVYF